MFNYKINGVVVDNTINLNFSLPKLIENYKSCDIYVNDYNFLFVCDSLIFRYVSSKKIDTKDLKNLEIFLKTDTNQFTCNIPCFPDDVSKEKCIKDDEIGKEQNNKQDELHPPFDVMDIRKLTDSSSFFVDNETIKFEKKFSYGFGCRFHDDTTLIENTLKPICKITNPSQYSRIYRRYLREKDELQDFCRDQYKFNFIELPVPDGFDNPTKYTYDFSDTKLTKDQEYILNNRQTKTFNVNEDERSIIDCGLLEILFGICYDIRTTQNEITCESGWTRSILSASLTYFEPVDNLSLAVEIFLRRSLIYPMYRNYDLSRLCIKDTIEALQHGKDWIIKQLMITYDAFQQSLDNRQLLSFYFIENYLRYLNSVVTEDHLNTLSRNLKNVLMNIKKKDLRLGLDEIEGELLKELIDDLHVADSDDSDDTDEESVDDVTDSSDRDSNDNNDYDVKFHKEEK